MDWLQVLTIAGSTIGACWMIHMESYKEMKDFHGRLERQDAEFKAHLIHMHREQR